MFVFCSKHTQSYIFVCVFINIFIISYFYPYLQCTFILLVLNISLSLICPFSTTTTLYMMYIGVCYPLLEIDRDTLDKDVNKQTCSDWRVKYITSFPWIENYIHKSHQSCQGQCIISNGGGDSDSLLNIDEENDLKYININNEYIFKNFFKMTCSQQTLNYENIYLSCEESNSSVVFIKQ